MNIILLHSTKQQNIAWNSLNLFSFSVHENLFSRHMGSYTVGRQYATISHIIFLNNKHISDKAAKEFFFNFHSTISVPVESSYSLHQALTDLPGFLWTPTLSILLDNSLTPLL